MLYKPNLEYLRSNEAMLTQERAERIRDASCRDGKKATRLRPRQIYEPEKSHTDGYYLLPTSACFARKIKR